MGGDDISPYLFKRKWRFTSVGSSSLLNFVLMLAPDETKPEEDYLCYFKIYGGG